MKRQKSEEEIRVTPDALALEVFKAMDAAFVIRNISEGNYSIDFTSDKARRLLPHLTADMRQSQLDPSSDEIAQFWRAVHTVGTTGIATKKDFILESSVSAKFLRVILLDQTYVVVLMKKTKERNQISRFLDHGPAEENLVTYLCDAIESDLIGQTLGMDSLLISLSSDMWELGVVTYYAVNPATAAICGVHPYMVRGKTTAEFLIPKPSVIEADKRWKEAFDPDTQRSSYAVEIQGGTTMYMETKQISPKLNLSILLLRKGKEARPKAISRERGQIAKIYKKHQWEGVLEDILELISEGLQYASTSRLKIPDSRNIFCYIYNGAEPFLPSRSADGFQWKSSFSAPSQGKMQKRYFYHKTEEQRMRRRVMWIDKLPHLQIIEYRHLIYHGEVQTDHLIGTEALNWVDVISQVTNRDDHKLYNTMEEI
ncbi:hypothetical protein PROFUN_08402, partial [Planoprotostelium fungivorum]